MPAPTAGWNPDSVPWELPNDQAPVLDNFLIRPGNIQARGAFSAIADISGSSSTPFGVVPAGAIAISNMATVGVVPWDAPILASTAAKLVTANTGLTWTDSLGNLQTSTVPSRHQVPGPRWINFDGTLYGLGFDSEATPLRDKSNSYYMAATQMLTMPFTTGQVVYSPNTSSAFVASAAPVAGPTGVAAWAPFLGVPAVFGGSAPHSIFNSSDDSASLIVETGPLTIPSSASLTSATLSVTFNATTTFITAHGAVVAVSIRTAATEAGLSSASWSSLGSFTMGTASGSLSASYTLTSLTTAEVNAGVFVEFSLSASGPFSTLSTNGIIRLATCALFATAVDAYASSTPTALSAAPQGAVDIAGYLGRIWLAQGCDTPGGTGTSGSFSPSVIHSPTALYFSNPIVAGGGGTNTDWIDPSTFLTNVIKIDQDSSDPITGLSALRTGLVIFRRNSVYLLKGTTTANFQIVQLSDETGCLDPRSIIETDSGIYFVGQKGLMLTDGSKVSNASGNITYTLQQAINAQQWNVTNSFGGYITCGLTTQGQIIMSIGAIGTGGAPSRLDPIFSAMYDPTYQAWTRLTSALWAVDGVTSTFNYPGLIVSDRATALRSVHSIGSKYVVMLEDQQLAYSFLNQSSLYDTDTAGASHAIPLVWKTRYAPIIGTTTLSRKWGQARRYFLDHTLAVGSGTLVPGTSPGWLVTPVDAADAEWVPADNNVMTSTMIQSVTGGPVTSGYGVVPSVQIQRENLDFVAEVDDLGFDITYTDASTTNTAAGVIANIYGVGVEYQPTRDRR